MKQSPDMRHHTRGPSFVGRASTGQFAWPVLGALRWPPCMISILGDCVGLRVLAACLVQWYVQRSGSPRVGPFPDAEYYWFLARTIEGAPFDIIEWGNITTSLPCERRGIRCSWRHARRFSVSSRLQSVLSRRCWASVVWLVHQLTRRLVSPAEARAGFRTPLLDRAFDHRSLLQR